jgi:NhaP-type Na+/H+ or K+/H+ antiporter
LKFISILLSLIIAGIFLKILSHSYENNKEDDDDKEDDNYNKEKKGTIHIN